MTRGRAGGRSAELRGEGRKRLSRLGWKPKHSEAQASTGPAGQQQKQRMRQQRSRSAAPLSAADSTPREWGSSARLLAPSPLQAAASPFPFCADCRTLCPALSSCAVNQSAPIDRLPFSRPPTGRRFETSGSPAPRPRPATAQPGRDQGLALGDSGGLERGKGKACGPSLRLLGRSAFAELCAIAQ